MLNEDAHRTDTCESPICDCGMERESVEHFLWRCSKYQSARNTMLDTINDILKTDHVLVSQKMFC